MKEKVGLEMTSVIYPQPVSQFYDLSFQPVDAANFTYYSPNPSEVNWFWLVGNGELPSTNQLIIEFFDTNYGLQLEMRGKTLREGFKFIKP